MKLWLELELIIKNKYPMVILLVWAIMELVENFQVLLYSKWRELNHLHEEHLCFSYTVMTNEMKCARYHYWHSCFILLYFIDLSKFFLIEGYFCLCFIFNFYWSIVDLQYCKFTNLKFVTFRYTVQWISYPYTYIYTFLDSFPIYVNTPHIHHRELSRAPSIIAVVLISYLLDLQ